MDLKELHEKKSRLENEIQQVESAIAVRERELQEARAYVARLRGRLDVLTELMHAVDPAKLSESAPSS
jgi:septal ring factor EnvC (AmiA/AmiB activator)